MAENLQSAASSNGLRGDAPRSVKFGTILMACFALLGALPMIPFLVMMVWKSEYLGALWTHPLGIKMSLYAGLAWALYYVLILALCMGLNRAAPGTTALWTVLLGTILFVLLVFPAIFVILVGFW